VPNHCSPITILPHLSRLFVDYTASPEPLAPFYAVSPADANWMLASPPVFAGDRAAMVARLEAQNRTFGAGQEAFRNIEKLRKGAPVVVTGQQVTLLGGPLFVLYKAATAIERARAAGAVPVFWLASEDHDLDEVNHTTLSTRHELRTLRLAVEGAGRPVGGLKLGAGIAAVLDEAAGLLGDVPEMELLREAYRPEATLAEAFGQWMAKLFARQGLIVIDASTREWHAAGAGVLRQAIERAAELESLLLARNALLTERGYHAQVLVAERGSLLFLIEKETGLRLPLRRGQDGAWQAGRQTYSTADLLAILDAEPERLSPNALLRPVFQDAILPTAAYIGGPAEVAYFAQTQVLYEALLGRTTPVLPRISATLIEPAVAKIMAHDEVSLADVLNLRAEELLQRLGARAMPIEGKRRLAAAGQSLDAELAAVTEWMRTLDAGLGRAADTAASKMRYQMNRLRRLAANYQIQKEASLKKHVDAMTHALAPGGHPQERAVAGLSYLAVYGEAVLDAALAEAREMCPGHREIFL
jgi:bacillithiol biosynthesis cysteine-adding enzyme BshC